MWEAYPRKVDKGQAYKKYKARLEDGFSHEQLYEAVKNYAAQCKKQRTETMYIKHGKTFLGESTPFLDYLPKDKPAQSEAEYDETRIRSEGVSDDEFGFAEGFTCRSIRDRAE